MSIKKTLFETLLSEENVLVLFYPDIDTVIPDFLRTPENSVIKFEYGFEMPIPITDLVLTEDGIRATLSFNRTPHSTFVPWKCIVTMHTETTQIVFRNLDTPEPLQELPKNKKPKLTLVK